MVEPLVAYLHYLSIVLTGGFLIGEMVLCRPGMTEEQRRRLPVIDVIFFVSALVALATGLLRLFFYSKGVGFYLGNPFFWAKMALYVSVAVLSVRPTLTFGRWKRAIAAGSAAPPAPGEIAGVRRLLHIEVGLFALMPLMAVLMARGIGR